MRGSQQSARLFHFCPLRRFFVLIKVSSESFPTGRRDREAPELG